ncbi:MAG: DUF512 domain-containing protein [Lachnoclostridium edouardi]|uniref:DUF512 domain-containing protein n=1 Tax=Lachnoclostridium edouardi TaxID=1926283 RepID=UPI0026DC40EC|nr:DUF512 domain-containing protein [Lachnoclostridium edouardi]MDO4278573.1 DUF512 domain-containing protein [Lachnoclostridium edouardi]
MNQVKGHRIMTVDPGSIGEELELEPGDYVISINGNQIEDIFDYEYYVDSPSLIMEVRKADGEEWELEIENDYEDLGLTFENGLMSEYRSCCNKCIFCFIDQMPPGMRETLYFKDDDSRLSFLQGNYITLTNMKDKDIDRIIKFHLAPINISVHTTNPDLRCRMLHNRFAGEALKKIDRLFQAGTPMNGQIVLCKGFNDGLELERTIKDLEKYVPCMESLSVVPVGLSKYRDGLEPLEPFTKEDACQVIDIIERWQKIIYKKHGIHFVHASDEFYLLAGRQLPEEERYDGYIQLENGVGMTRLMTEEVCQALKEAEGDGRTEELSIATGVLPASHIKIYVEQIMNKFPGLHVHVYPIINYFFGESITVAGLITGQDLISQLKGKPLGSRLLLPECMFRSGEEVFLDDITREEVQNALQVPVNIVKSSGQDFVNTVLNPEWGENQSSYEGYELNDINSEGELYE